MEIKIVRNTAAPFPELVWYANRINEVFTPYTEDQEYYYVWHGQNDEYPVGGVKKADCVILNEGSVNGGKSLQDE